MKLAELLGLKIWNPEPAPAETADSAENPQRFGLETPQIPAESCGKVPTTEIRSNPQPLAESEAPVIAKFQEKSANPQNPQSLPEITEPALPITTDCFVGLGMNLLAEDLTFLRKRLPVATQDRNAAVREYVRRWYEGMGAEPAEYRKDNAGRWAANSWLRSRAFGRGRVSENKSANHSVGCPSTGCKQRN